MDQRLGPGAQDRLPLRVAWHLHTCQGTRPPHRALQSWRFLPPHGPGFLFRPSVAIPCHPGLSSDVPSGRPTSDLHPFSPLSTVCARRLVSMALPGWHWGSLGTMPMFGGESWKGPCLSLHSLSSSACSWSHLKTMISFYLVLFYATLISLSRQVSRRPLLLPAQPLTCPPREGLGRLRLGADGPGGKLRSGTRVTPGSRQ